MAAALLCGASGLQVLHAQDPAAAAPAAPDAFTFSSDRVMILWTVKSAGAADFESAWSTIKTKLAASEKQELKDQAASISLLKLGGPAAGAQTLYLMDLNPVSKTLSYDAGKILFAPGFVADRAEAEAIYNKIAQNAEGINPFPMVTKVGE